MSFLTLLFLLIMGLACAIFLLRTYAAYKARRAQRLASEPVNKNGPVS